MDKRKIVFEILFVGFFALVAFGLFFYFQSRPSNVNTQVSKESSPTAEELDPAVAFSKFEDIPSTSNIDASTVATLDEFLNLIKGSRSDVTDVQISSVSNKNFSIKWGVNSYDLKWTSPEDLSTRVLDDDEFLIYNKISSDTTHLKYLTSEDVGKKVLLRYVKNDVSELNPYNLLLVYEPK